jgi:3-deoxy-7-phosphoheptulonate synthase
MLKTQDLHVVETRPLVSPALLHHEFPMTGKAAALVAQARDRIRNILYNEDQRLASDCRPLLCP